MPGSQSRAIGGGPTPWSATSFRHEMALILRRSLSMSRLYAGKITGAWEFLITLWRNRSLHKSQLKICLAMDRGQGEQSLTPRNPRNYSFRKMAAPRNMRRSTMKCCDDVQHRDLTSVPDHLSLSILLLEVAKAWG